MTDLLFHMADTVAVRAVSDERWTPYYKHLTQLSQSLEHNGWKRKTGMTKLDIVASHLLKTGTISIREAMADYGISGGSLTKYISILRNEKGWAIRRVFKTHPITKTRYARYDLVDAALIEMVA